MVLYRNIFAFFFASVCINANPVHVDLTKRDSPSQQVRSAVGQLGNVQDDLQGIKNIGVR